MYKLQYCTLVQHVLAASTVWPSVDWTLLSVPGTLFCYMTEMWAAVKPGATRRTLFLEGRTEPEEMKDIDQVHTKNFEKKLLCIYSKVPLIYKFNVEITVSSKLLKEWRSNGTFLRSRTLILPGVSFSFSLSSVSTFGTSVFRQEFSESSVSCSCCFEFTEQLVLLT